MLYLLALHIIFVVTWFAGLFYIVRLFVYHAEANEKPEPEKSILTNHFKIAERRLWYGITWPSAICTYVFGMWLLYEAYGSEIPSWLKLKLGFVAALTIYHLICGRMLSRFQKDEAKYSSTQMRLWNEVATIFLVVIVFIVVMKDLSNWLYGFAGMILFTVVLLSAIKIYKNQRKR